MLEKTRNRRKYWEQDYAGLGEMAFLKGPHSKSLTGSSRGYGDLLREIELTGGLAYGPQAFLEQHSANDARIRPEVQEVFVITNTGLLVERYSYTGTMGVDADIFSAMFKAVQCFVEDSFGSHGTNLKELRMGNLDILITQGRYITLVLIVKAGGDAKVFEPNAQKTVMDLENDNKQALRSWYGDKDSIKGLKEAVDRLVEGAD